MNREILFRGKNKITNKFVFGDLFHHGEQAFIAADNRNSEVILETIGQFTGLTDKNGVKIFERDILDLTDFLIMDAGVVKFGEYKDLDMGNDYPCGNVGFYVDVENQRISVRKDILFLLRSVK